jgi:hypothetical protein
VTYKDPLNLALLLRNLTNVRLDCRDLGFETGEIETLDQVHVKNQGLRVLRLSLLGKFHLIWHCCRFNNLANGRVDFEDRQLMKSSLSADQGKCPKKSLKKEMIIIIIYFDLNKSNIFHSIYSSVKS